MTGVLQFLAGQMSTPPEPKANLSGKTILVTGANSGLGLDAAKLLVRMKCTTIVLCTRSQEKCDQARRDILAATSKSTQTKPEIIGFTIDLGSLQSVVACAEKCRTLPRLDAAVLNAGIDTEQFSLAEGFESTITVNVISTFLFATLLLPQLRESARKYDVTPTLAIVGSAVHAWANTKDLTSPSEGKILRTLSDPKQAKMKERYFLSKLPVMLLVRHLSKKLEDSAAGDSRGKPLVVINNVAPGLCKTSLFRHDDSFATRVPLKILGRTSEHGARCLVHGAVAGKESHGQYLSECQVKNASPFINSAEGSATAERIWKELALIYEEVQPGCSSVW